MAWLRTPLHDPHPYWEPEWGLHLLRDEDDARDKNTPIFGSSDEFIQDHLTPKLLESCFGKNRRVFAVCNNGTTAVTLAMANAADPSLIRLIGIGSYAGAFWSSMSISSVPCDIRGFYKRNRTTLESIIHRKVRNHPRHGPHDINTSWTTFLMSWGTCAHDMCAPRHQ